MHFLARILKNWSFIGVFISIVFLWYYITFNPVGSIDRTLVLSLSLGAVVAYITHSTLQAMKIESSLEQMSDEISKGFSYRVISDRDEFLGVLRTTIRNAKSRICVTHFDSKPPIEPYRSEERAQYWRANDDVINADKVSFTRLISVDGSEKLNWIERQLEDYADCGKYNVYAVNLGSENPVVMEMLIVDETTAMFWPSTHDRDETYIWISGRPELIVALQRCFDAFQSKASCIKDGRLTNTEALNSLLTR